MIVAMVVLWGLRLSGYLALRNSGNGEDSRYVAMRKRAGRGFWWKSLFTVFILQGVLMWIVSSPVQVALSRMPTASKNVSVFDSVGAVLWLVGMFFETVGDFQLARFKKDPASAGQVMDRGLWKYTRHPNYFGDFCVWWGLYAIAAASATGRWAIIGPIAMSTLLLRVSGVTLLEKGMTKRRPGYAEYVERTSAFFPRPPRSSRSPRS